METVAKDGIWLVICRIGSLERIRVKYPKLLNVICRIGSLEINLQAGGHIIVVICRIGSLEIFALDPL